jgi:hypothetical protein
LNFANTVGEFAGIAASSELFGVSRYIAAPLGSLRNVQLKLVKIGPRVVSYSRRTIFQCGEVAVSAALFSDLLERIHALTAAPT